MQYMEQDGMEALDTLAKYPFINPREAAVIKGVNVSTVRRQFKELRKDGLATCHMVGRGGHLEQRWVLTKEGLERRFGSIFNVPRQLTEAGLPNLYRKMDQLRDLYRIAPALFDNLEWDCPWAPGTPRLTGCHFIRGGKRGPGLIQAALTYTHGISVWFGRVGTQLGEPQIMQRWERHLDDLDRGRAAEYFRRIDRLNRIDPHPDIDPTPRPSVYLVVGADELATVQAYQSLPGEVYRDGRQPFIFINAESGGFHLEGIVNPRPHEIYDDDEFYAARIGDPGKVARFDGPPHPEDLFGETLFYMVFELVAQWPGLIVQDIARRCRRSKGEVAEVVQQLTGMGWLQERGGMLYLGKGGIIFVSRRDGVSVNGVEARVGDAITQDHRQVGAHRIHTAAVNRLMVRLHEAGIRAFPGWRAVLDIPGVTQLKPDMVMFAETPLGRGLHYIEVERTAKSPEQVAKKFAPYREAHRMGYSVPVIFITGTPEAEELFRRQGRNLPVLTCTLADARRGPLAGNPSVFRRDGQAVPLRPIRWF